MLLMKARTTPGVNLVSRPTCVRSGRTWAEPQANAANERRRVRRRHRRATSVWGRADVALHLPSRRRQPEQPGVPVHRTSEQR